MNKIIHIIAVTHIFFTTHASDKLEEKMPQNLSPKSLGRTGLTRSKSPSSPIERLKKDHQDHNAPEKHIKATGSN